MLRAICLRSAVRGAAVAAASRSVSTSLRRTSYKSTGIIKTLSPVTRLGSVAAVRAYSADSGLTKESVEGRIMSLLSGFDKVNDNNNIKPNAHFANDLGLDSLDTVEVVMAIEEEFSIEIPDKDADAIHSVAQAVDYILKQPDAN